MPRRSTNGTAATATINAVPLSTTETQYNPFELDEMIDLYAVPIASEIIKQRLPERVKHHIRRLLTSNEESDRAELLEIMKGAKLGICFAVYSAVLSYARETAQARLKGANEQSLSEAPANHSEVG